MEEERMMNIVGQLIPTKYEQKLLDKITFLEKDNKLLTEALEKMCEWHEKQSTWDKGDNGYYNAKSLLKQTKN